MCTLETNLPPMTADKAREHVDRHEQTPGRNLKAKRTLMRMALKHGNLSDGARQVYADYAAKIGAI
jgi:hypothetical protein